MGQILRISDFINQWKKDRRVRIGITVAAVLVSALIQSYALQVFVRPAGIISGGFTGMAMLVERLGELKGLNIPMQVTMLLLNIPVAFLCCKGISIRFTVFSLVQVFLSSIFLQIFDFRGNASTGGTDFIALFVSNRTGHSIWSYVFFGNAVMYCFYGAIFGWKHAGYSIIFQFISTRMISAFHHRYELVTLQATTIKGREVVDAYISHFRHGMSCVEAMGGYSKKKMYLLNTVISAYEVNNAIHIMQEADEHIIINVLRTQQFVGRFYRAPME